MGEYTQILVKKNKVDFIQFFQKLIVKKYNIFLILLQISLPHKKNSTSRNKDILSTVPTYELTKTEDFEHFLLKILPPQK